MSKIEEMAANYSSKIYNEIQGGVPYSDLSDYVRGKLDGIDPYVEDAYIEGANAVLSEIEKFIKSKEMNGYNYILCEVLKDKIKRLKGE